MTIAIDGQPRASPVAADAAHQATHMTADFVSRWDLAGPQQSRNRTRRRGLVDVDRQKAAFVVICVEQPDLDGRVHPRGTCNRCRRPHPLCPRDRGPIAIGQRTRCTPGIEEKGAVPRRPSLLGKGIAARATRRWWQNSTRFAGQSDKKKRAPELWKWRPSWRAGSGAPESWVC